MGGFFYEITCLKDSNASEVLDLIFIYKVYGQDLSYLLLCSQCLKYGRHLMDIFKRINADLDCL